MTRSVTATTWLQIEPIIANYSENLVRGAKVKRATQTRPEEPLVGTILVKLNVKLPVSAFDPLAEATVIVPEGLVSATPIEVEAKDTGEDQ